MKPQRAFDSLSDWIEWFLARWWGASLYLFGAIVWCSWDGADRYVTMTGAVILVLLVGGGRRDSKATHAKLDDIDDRDDMTRIEESSEEEIEARRR